MDKDKKYNIILGLMIFFFVIIVGIAIAFGLGYIGINKNASSNNNSQDNANSNLQTDTSTNTINDNTTDENTKNNDTIQKIYSKLSNSIWASKKNINDVYTFNEDSIVSSQNFKIPFKYGKVKYLVNIINGGMLSSFIALTENGEAYKITSNTLDGDLGSALSTYNASNLKITKVNISEKIIDLTYANYVNSNLITVGGPYYLTETGKLLNENGKSYEEINRNHVASIGNIDGIIYINEDKTLETLRTFRTLNTYEYIYIVDENNQNVKSKYVFFESSTRWTGTTSNHYYVVDENGQLLDFSSNSLMVAYEYYEAKGKIVHKLEYDETNFTIKVIFTDGSSITIENIYNKYTEVN